ncbi:DUF1987 domain-containing protein [Desulfovibrio inopinatus]|uniref:DUF1987 domain-containing protein n=1 Tax=Desulfovibrio inopinatus TaxID=102109 RepID=UPI000423688F|nr:DUF1987 domain-containing protein [Desulfovibrio inopinatus]
MNTLQINTTERSPEIFFDFDNNNFIIKGESYPEDVKEFYGPPLTKLEDYLNDLEDADVRFTFEFIYFNSSTAKILMGLFELLDEVAERGNTVSVIWVYEEDDDNMEELGEEFGEDLEHATFIMQAQ